MYRARWIKSLVIHQFRVTPGGKLGRKGFLSLHSWGYQVTSQLGQNWFGLGLPALHDLEKTPLGAEVLTSAEQTSAKILGLESVYKYI